MFNTMGVLKTIQKPSHIFSSAAHGSPWPQSKTSQAEITHSDEKACVDQATTQSTQALSDMGRGAASSPHP